MRRILAGAAVSICILFLFLPFSFGFTSAQPTDFNSSSDLVVGEDERIVISGPEYAVKGNIIVREDGILEIQDTDFEIYQDDSDRSKIELESSANLKLIDSTLASAKKVDLKLDPGSTLNVKNSTLNLPGEIKGTPKSVRVLDSELGIQNINFDATEVFIVEDSIVESDGILVSSPKVYLNRSVFRTELIFYDETVVKAYGSLFDSIETNSGSEASIYEKVILSVKDKLEVPIGRADVVVERLGYENWMHRVETDKNGEWVSYLLAEEIGPDRSLFKGNYEIRVDHDDYGEKTTISLSPAEKRTPERRREELKKKIDIKLADVLQPTSYYYESQSDLEIDGTSRHVIETYSGEGIENYVQQGNILLTGNGTLVVGEKSSVKVLQNEESYRMELRDSSELRVRDQGSIGSDAPLNVYLYGDSSLSLNGAELELGSLYMGDSSTLTAKNTRIEANHIHFQGNQFDLENSVIESNSLEVDAQTVSLQRSKIYTNKNVTLGADRFEVVDMDFERSVFFKSKSNNRISITNVTAEEISPMGDLTIERRWYLRAEIFNGEDRLVPSVDLNIYRQVSLERELVETVFVEDGKIKVPLKSEVINSEVSRFVGNYILEANKSVNGDVVESETTMVAVDSNVKAGLKFKEEFPYRIVIDVDLPERVEPGEVFEIKGRAYYQGVDLEVNNATVEVGIDEDGDLRWNTTTDDTGRFNLEVQAPGGIGTSSLNLRVHDKKMMMESELAHSLEISRDDELSVRGFLFTTTIGRFISITVIFVLLLLAYKIITTPMYEKEPSISSSDNMVNWTEKSLKKE